MIACDILKISRQIVKNGRVIEKTGKPVLPRYLYHVTSRENYEEILKSGVIKTSDDVNLESKLNGVFMFDMKNFAKRWVNTFIPIYEDLRVNLGGALLNMKAIKDDNLQKVTDIVLLRIPTKNMDINKLKIRPQNAMNKCDSAIYQTLYTRRKNPIEYIYGEDIDILSAEKIGEARLEYNSIRDFSDEMAKKPFDILLKLLKGQPEEKGVKIFSQQNFREGFIKLDSENIL